MVSNKFLKIILNLGIALIPAVLAFVLIMFEPLYGIDAMLCDLVYSQMNGTGDEIKLICIDEETLSAYGSLSEFSRDKSAELLNVLYEDESSAPAVTAFDIMFIGPTDETVDKKLAEAAKGKNVVTATNLVYRGRTRYNASGMPYYDARNIEMEERPYEALNAEVTTGYANAEHSKDGFVRTTSLSTSVNGETRYSFATQIYLKYMEACGNSNAAASLSGKENQLQFFYSGKPGEFMHYSLKDVLDKKIPASAFKDSIILVGAYAPGLTDSYHSAATRSQEMYGVEINANIVRALMLDKTATRLPSLYIALIAAAVFFIYMILARQMNMYPALIIGVWIIIADFVAGRLLAVNGRLMSLLYILLVCLLIMAYIIVEKYVLESIRKKKVVNSFKKYMEPEVIEQLMKDDSFQIELGGTKRNVAVLFVDIRGFTTMSESLSPEEVVKILNRYLTLVSECIFEHKGMLDKFIGDAAMAIFNAPSDQDDYVYQAVLAGLDMQKKGTELGKTLLDEYGKTVSFGVGVHVGDAVVGNIGSEMRMDYTAIGDTVNTASRIEGKSSGGEVLISEEVYELLKDRIETEFKEEMALKGKAKPVPVYKVTGVK